MNARSFDVLRKQECPHWDEYKGTVDVLLAAGVITEHQVLGAHGNNATSQTFHGGVADSRTTARRCGEQWMCVRQTGRGLLVQKGIGEAERARRAALRDRAPAAQLASNVINMREWLQQRTPAQ